MTIEVAKIQPNPYRNLDHYQIDRAKDYTRESGLTLVDIFADNGYSGGQWNRPGLNNMLKAIRANRFQVIVLWNLDRLARDTELFLNIWNQLLAKNIQIYSITEGLIDMQTANGRFMNTVIAASNELYRRVIGDKVKKTYEAKKAKGEKWGRPRALTDKQIMLIRELNGTAPANIKKFLNLQCSVQTVRRALKTDGEPFMKTLNMVVEARKDMNKERCKCNEKMSDNEC